MRRLHWRWTPRGSTTTGGPGGSSRLHKTMRDILRVRAGSRAPSVHDWFLTYWTERSEPSLAWFHRWTLDPEAALGEWQTQQAAALKHLRIGEARELLSRWADVAL